MRRAAFLDRDGVINVDQGYVHRIEDFEFVPGTLQACRELARLSPTLQHQCLLAEHLLGEGLNDEAALVLEKGLEDYRFTPGHFRRRNRRIR